MNIINMATKDLVPYQLNAKVHPDEQIVNGANSIKRFGWQQPLVIDENNVVIIGHCRLLAAKRLGLQEVPVTVASGLTDEEIRELRIADNKTNESAWDFDMLERDREGLAFEGFQFEWMQPDEEYEEPPEPEVSEDNFDPDEDIPKESDIREGDVFILGEHRLMCGNSCDIDDVLTLMGGAKADLFLTDPPYNVDYHGSTGMTIKNDSMEDGSFRAFLIDAFSCAHTVMRAGAGIYIWHADSEGFNFRAAMREVGWKLRQTLIWVKNAPVLGRQDYLWKHEPCLYAWKEGTHYFTADRTNKTVFDDKVDIKKLSKQEMRELLEKIFTDKVPTSVIYEDKPLVNDLHPTMKPIKLMARLIVNSSKPGWNVLDLFGGSGSTMMACEQLGRRCFTMELDPKYCLAELQRFQKFRQARIQDRRRTTRRIRRRPVHARVAAYRQRKAPCQRVASGAA